MSEVEKIIVELVHLNIYSFGDHEKTPKPAPESFCKKNKTSEIGVNFTKGWVEKMSRPTKKSDSEEYIMICTHCWNTADMFLTNKIMIDDKTYKEYKESWK